MASWAIDSGGALRDKWRDQLGDEEFEARRQVAADKLEGFPQSEWEQQSVIGGQFEALAMQCPQRIFDQLKDRDYKFWSALVLKVCT